MGLRDDFDLPSDATGGPAAPDDRVLSIIHQHYYDGATVGVIRAKTKMASVDAVIDALDRLVDAGKVRAAKSCRIYRGKPVIRFYPATKGE